MRTLALSLGLAAGAAAQDTEYDPSFDEVVPYKQDRPPGPPRSPTAALAAMEVPEGFTVELVACEPDLVNPVAMTFDERGRIWVAESIEYPRRAAGPGRDRIKVFEDTTGDGRADRVHVFADGLNIPSGLAVGYGGAWVVNAPDLLFLRDTDGDGRADEREVVVTGFGRKDTHELPNSLTWGPDGWLYGLNGVYNPSRVEHRGETFEFTCALFRVHPRTRAFELFAEGTSNPWGLAFDDEGSAFVSACVIDHLWHLAEGGEYHRQSGDVPAFSWQLGSVVEHTHQKAAYCGLHWLDTDAYPERYRQRLVMGNIHGGALNVDVLVRDGATYRSDAEPDLLVAHDAWFMPVAQDTGPDGCLYVLDWYDRYHCYQDAGRDPGGIDRGHGRLYRLRYGDGPRRAVPDLAREADDALVARLASGNPWERRTARRLLAERARGASARALEALALDAAADRAQRLEALWARAGAQDPLPPAFLAALMDSGDATFRAWGVRLAGDTRPVAEAVAARVAELASDPDPRVLREVAGAARKLAGPAAVPALVAVARHCADDRLVPAIVWQNLHPLLAERPHALLAALSGPGFAGIDVGGAPALAALLPRATERLSVAGDEGRAAAAALLAALAGGPAESRAVAGACLARLAERARGSSAEEARRLHAALGPAVERLLDAPSSEPVALDAALFVAGAGDPRGLAAARAVFANVEAPAELRLAALDALVAAGAELLPDVAVVLADPRSNSLALRGEVVAGLGRLDDARVAELLLAHYPAMEPELRPRVVQLCSQRAEWARPLVAAVAAGTVPPSALSSAQGQRIAALDPELESALAEHWGTIRAAQRPERDATIARVRGLLRARAGDPFRGETVFRRVCAQCHTIYGEGADVGPDLTANGRSSLEQLLTEVLDPSLVVGPSYRARIVRTTDGRLLAGLAVEDSDERIVLRLEGGETEAIPRAEVEATRLDVNSLMPEGLEEQVSEDELVDLFAFLTLDRHPSDPAARRLAGAAPIEEREAFDPTGMTSIVEEVAPGFSTEAVGDDGVALLADHAGRAPVVRVHPVSPTVPCILRRSFELPADVGARLVLVAGHHPRGDWRLVVRVGGEVLLETDVGPETAPEGWLERWIDLSRFAGGRVELAVENHATGWRNEYGYFFRIEVVTE